MIILDRVYCDLCEVDMGQLLAGPVQAPGLLADLSVPPYVCLCPDCRPSPLMREITDEDEAFIIASFAGMAA